MSRRAGAVAEADSTAEMQRRQTQFTKWLTSIPKRISPIRSQSGSASFSIADRVGSTHNDPMHRERDTSTAFEAFHSTPPYVLDHLCPPSRSPIFLTKASKSEPITFTRPDSTPDLRNPPRFAAAVMAGVCIKGGVLRSISRKRPNSSKDQRMAGIPRAQGVWRSALNGGRELNGPRAERCRTIEWQPCRGTRPG
jgi:hypothetical protein